MVSQSQICYTWGMALSGLQSQLEVVGLEVMSESVKAGTHLILKSWREKKTVPAYDICSFCDRQQVEWIHENTLHLAIIGEIFEKRSVEFLILTLMKVAWGCLLFLWSCLYSSSYDAALEACTVGRCATTNWTSKDVWRWLWVRQWQYQSCHSRYTCRRYVKAVFVHYR